jgi:hypothetical protein
MILGIGSFRLPVHIKRQITPVEVKTTRRWNACALLPQTSGTTSLEFDLDQRWRTFGGDGGLIRANIEIKDNAHRPSSPRLRRLLLLLLLLPPSPLSFMRLT